MKRWKRLGSGVLCLMILVVGMCLHLILPDSQVSAEERRRLAQAPELDLEAVSTGSFMEDAETYLQDQFPFRQQFRQIKAWFWYYPLGMKDNHGIYFAKGQVGKLHYPLSESSVTRFTDKIKSLREKYFPESEVYVAVIPEKNYYLAAPNGYPDLDYERMWELLRGGLEGVNLYDLSEFLEAEDYYRTDIHWRQERIADVAAALAFRMNGDVKEEELLAGLKEAEAHTVKGFYGSYYGQAAVPMPSDDLIYLTTPAVEAASVWHLESGKETPVYDVEKLTDERSLDRYDVFLSGADALQVITSPSADNGKELIVFRDSFASSLLPLMLSAYEKITVIDLRYIASELLGRYVDFEGEGKERPDVLFLYNTQLINQSAMLR